MNDAVETPVPHLLHIFPGMGKYDWHVRCRFEKGFGPWRKMGTVDNKR